MPLATILVLSAILGPWLAGVVPIAQATAVQQTQPQEAPPAGSPQETSSQEPSKPAEQEPKPDQSAAPQQLPAPAPASSEQPEKPQLDSAAKNPTGKTTSSTGKKTRKHNKHKPTAQPGPGPTKTVVRDGSTSDPAVQINPSLSEEQASHQRQNTTQLLATTDANLKKMSGRGLSSGQQDTVDQIRKYMEQAKAAVEAGDLQRAHNLAFKAHLLSNELVK